MRKSWKERILAVFLTFLILGSTIQSSFAMTEVSPVKEEENVSQMPYETGTAEQVTGRRIEKDETDETDEIIGIEKKRFENTQYKNTEYEKTEHETIGRKNTEYEKTEQENTECESTEYEKAEYENTEWKNTEYENTERENTEDENIEYENTGDENIEHDNTEDENIGDDNTEIENTKQEPDFETVPEEERDLDKKEIVPVEEDSEENSEEKDILFEETEDRGESESEFQIFSENLPNKETPDPYANQTCVILYENGDLFFQKGREVDSSRGDVLLGPVPDIENTPWSEYSDQIRKVIFQDICRAPQSLRKWFSGCVNLEEIENLENLQITDVTDISAMFENCTKLVSLDLSNWNFSKLTDLSGIFQGCSALERICCRGWGIERETEIAIMVMFRGCKKLKEVDLSGWTFRKVDSVNNFSRCLGLDTCTELRKINVSGWNMPECEKLDGMFRDCYAERIDMRGMYAPKVKSIKNMFSSCVRLAEINGIENLDVSQVTDMSFAFEKNVSLRTLNINQWNTGKVQVMSNMFQGCTLLEHMDLCNWDVKSLIRAQSMFEGCSNLRSLNLSNWDLYGCNLASGTFYGFLYNTPKLQYLNFSFWKLPASISAIAIVFSQMGIRNCEELQVINLSNWEIREKTSLNSAFSGCRFRELILDNWKTMQFTDMAYAFTGCENLTTLNLSEWDTSEVESMKNMFQRCNQITSLNIAGNYTENSKYAEAATDQLKNLKEVTVDEISGVPDFLYDLLLENESWVDQEKGEMIPKGKTLQQKTTLYRMKTPETTPDPEPEVSPAPEAIHISIITKIDGEEIERLYHLSIYDKAGNCVASGNSKEDLYGYFEYGETYSVEIEDSYEKNFSLDMSGEEFIFDGKKEYKMLLSYTSKAVITTKKVWNDKENEDRNRPQQLEVILYCNGKPVRKEILSEENGWTYTWPDLPRYDKNGVENVWEVRETVPPGYTESYTHVETEKEEEFSDVYVKIIKIWQDDSNIYGLRRKIVFHLWRECNGKKEEIEKRTYEWKDGNHFTAGWYHLPKYDEDHNEILYSVTEDSIPFYESQSTNTVSEAGFCYTFINTHQEKETVKIKKCWTGIDYHENSVQVNLVNGKNEKIPVTLRGYAYTSEWDSVSVQVPKYDENGKRIEYSVFEDDPDEKYHKTISGNMKDGFLIINDYHQETSQKEVTVQKIWKDSFSDENRPYLAKIVLGYYKNAVWVPVDYFYTSRNEKKTMKVPVYQSDGSKIQYYVREEPIIEKDTVLYGSNAYGDLAVTDNNVKVVNYRYIEIEKEWLDGNDRKQTRPDSVEVELCKNGNLYKTYVLSPDNNWKVKIDELPWIEEGSLIEWSVKEKDILQGYQMLLYKSDNKYRIRNINYWLNVEISKQWEDQENADGTRPDFVEVELYADNELYGTYRITKENDWKILLEDLPYCREDKAIQYEVKEINVPDGYEASVSSRTVTTGKEELTCQNVLTNIRKQVPESPGYQICKYWKDEENKHGYRPESIEIELLANGECVECYTLSEENQWSVTLLPEELPEEDGDGKTIHYTVREKKVPLHYEDAYSSYTSENASGSIRHLDIINTETKKTADIQWEIENTPKKISLTVRKEWNTSSSYDLTEKNVYVQLYRRIMPVDQLESKEYGKEEAVGKPIELNSENVWTYQWKGLAEYRNGYPILYSVEEVDSEGEMMLPKGFVKTITSNAESGEFVIQNASTKVLIEKRNTLGEKIKGAQLEILDNSKNVIAEWVTGENGHLLEAILEPGTEYWLHEVKAPEGYKKAEDIVFEVRTDGEMQTIQMTDEKLVVLPQTGGRGRRLPWIPMAGVTISVAGIAFLYKRKSFLP